MVESLVHLLGGDLPWYIMLPAVPVFSAYYGSWTARWVGPPCDHPNWVPAPGRVSRRGIHSLLFLGLGGD